jgi:hypothetical protein
MVSQEDQCPENQWYVVPMPYDWASVHCDTACPGEWMGVESDGENWCFEPPTDFSTTPATAPTEEVYQKPPFKAEQPAAAKQALPSAPTPVWVFGLVAVVGIFALGALMPTPDEET